MNPPATFEETQSFLASTFLRWILLGTVLFCGGIIIYTTMTGELAAMDPRARWTFLLSVGSGPVVPLIILKIFRLTTRVNAEGLELHFRGLRHRRIPFAKIKSAAVRRYRPILEYGGWGIRYGLGAGWAYNVSGNEGVQLELADGERLLIGSQRAAELEAAVRKGKVS